MLIAHSNPLLFNLLHEIALLILDIVHDVEEFRLGLVWLDERSLNAADAR